MSTWDDQYYEDEGDGYGIDPDDYPDPTLDDEDGDEEGETKLTTATVIELKPVKSSRIAEAGYDENTFTLHLRFPPTTSDPAGAIYSYANVGEEMYDDFLNSTSMGTYYAKHLLKNSDHPCTKVEERQPVAETQADTWADVTRSRLAAAASEPQVPAQATGIPEVPEDEDALKLQALAVVDQVRALRIVSSDEYLTAGNELVRLREMKKLAQERVDRIKKPAYAAYQATLELERDVIGPYLRAEEFLNGGMADYRQKERTARLLKEHEETTRRRLEAEAEQKRKQQEAAEADAKAAEAQGQPEVAQQIRQQPLPLVPVRVQAAVLPKDVPKVKGIIERAPVWKWRVKPGEEHLVPREYLMLNEKAINAAVTHQKNLTNIAGIEVWDEEAKVAVKAGK